MKFTAKLAMLRSTLLVEGTNLEILKLPQKVLPRAHLLRGSIFIMEKAAPESVLNGAILELANVLRPDAVGETLPYFQGRRAAKMS